MQQMLTDLLAYTRVGGQTAAFTAVDCEAVLTRVMEALHLRIEECKAIITHDPLPTVYGDATRLGQVWQNLIGNALKFCKEPPPRIHITAQPEDHHWRFAVQDNGIGIDPRHAEHIFRFFSVLHSRSEYPRHGDRISNLQADRRATWWTHLGRVGIWKRRHVLFYSAGTKPYTNGRPNGAREGKTRR